MKLPEFHSCRLFYQYWARLRLANQFSSDSAFRLKPIPVLKDLLSAFSRGSLLTPGNSATMVISSDPAIISNKGSRCYLTVTPPPKNNGEECTFPNFLTIGLPSFPSFTKYSYTIGSISRTVEPSAKFLYLIAFLGTRCAVSSSFLHYSFDFSPNTV
jgi:hypothetical protein